jgi:hypothetical protein
MIFDTPFVYFIPAKKTPMVTPAVIASPPTSFTIAYRFNCHLMHP